MALAIEPRYSFEHDTTFNWRDLRLVLARSWFALTLAGSLPVFS